MRSARVLEAYECRERQPWINRQLFGSEPAPYADGATLPIEDDWRTKTGRSWRPYLYPEEYLAVDVDSRTTGLGGCSYLGNRAATRCQLTWAVGDGLLSVQEAQGIVGKLRERSAVWDRLWRWTEEEQRP